MFKALATLGVALALSLPDDAEQTQFWNEWNTTYRRAEKVSDLDYATLRRRDKMIEWLREAKAAHPRILDVGCSTGWFTARLAEFGDAAGVDLSTSAIEEAQALHPQIAFTCANFLQFDAPSPYDIVVSIDVLSCVADQSAFLSKVASLLKPGGFLLLTMPNRVVFERRTDVHPQGAGQIRQWQTRSELRRLLEKDFVVRHLTTVAPGGDRGFLRFVNNKAMNSLLAHAGLRVAIDRLKEKAGFGESLAVLAERRPKFQIRVAPT